MNIGPMINKRNHKERPKTACVYYGKPSPLHSNGTAYCTLTTYQTCDPDTCVWYKDEDMLKASFEKARQNYIKNHGSDDYYKRGYGPKQRRLPRTVEDEEGAIDERND